MYIYIYVYTHIYMDNSIHTKVGDNTIILLYFKKTQNFRAVYSHARHKFSLKKQCQHKSDTCIEIFSNNSEIMEEVRATQEKYLESLDPSLAVANGKSAGHKFKSKTRCVRE